MSLEKTLKMVKAEEICFSIILAVVGFFILIPALALAAETSWGDTRVTHLTRNNSKQTTN